MEMERINENTIRVILGNQDLEDRGITVLDLLGNHKQIESFFYSILEEVDKDHTFTSNDAVTFQVMPNKKGLELLISKGSPEGSEDTDDFAMEDDLSDDEEVSDYIKKQLQQSDNTNGPRSTVSHFNDVKSKNKKPLNGFTAKPEPEFEEILLEFSDFEDVISAADALQLGHAKSNLYSYQNKYYLDLIVYTADLEDINLSDAVAVAFEYGNRTKVTPEVLSEYGHLLMSENALSQINHYFG
ncbi:adaptor protein MecA [Lactobacillus sp. CC-MHH1034]|uniref:adaptor protein MecA n=1 Tax=Agrilactobacillus fermenti TaxID=2586909 RepID=UPI001E653D87|nr:adaptor protein MecA [Agrilactobacillus fermenti]MCD2255460.1 adaptor protein MecA [Agrilactobacillus fermenti]